MGLASLLGRILRPPHLSIAPEGSSAAASSNTAASTTQLCTIAAGCFWGVEHIYRRHFANKGLVDISVGYIGGKSDAPAYLDVCSGATGHAEAAQIVFDPSAVTYRQLLEFFYRIHDPTTMDRQGPDQGSQYRSAIFFHNADQEAIARQVTTAADKQWWQGNIVTKILPATQWWPAEDYHQKYLESHPNGYECPTHFLRPFSPLE
ncbi:hypothetical protein CDD82_1455 [Ophiocordyceps australis]|uniref:peptide-methionine (S)-S-oxide reductase n=1 Tax=Ophiocordyceps australis TaxID=1399860 RepID=A0A2C5ZG03_9HYPO|nr:hypothetical protein CDD82_1455 [Ophiocordyceps australis]